MVIVIEDPKFCDNVMKRMRNLHISQEEFCEKTGATPELLWDIECGRVLDIEHPVLNNIARVLRTTLPELSDFFCTDEEYEKAMKERYGDDWHPIVWKE